MERRPFLSILAAIPVAARIEGNTPGTVACSVCGTEFDPTTVASHEQTDTRRRMERLFDLEGGG